MLYEKSKAEKLSEELFKNPSNEYRGAPFWAWNSRLDPDRLRRQINMLGEMGFGGFFMHSRSGMVTEYLGEEFFDSVKTCVDEAEKLGMNANLYDEDRWPSGAAGGYVTKEPKYRQKSLVMLTSDRNDDLPKDEAIEKGAMWFVAAFDLTLNADNEIVSYKRIRRDDTAQGKKIYFFCEPAKAGDPWYNYQTYVDTLSSEAVDRFIEITYEKYKRELGKDFGTRCPLIFSDEPQIRHWDGMSPNLSSLSGTTAWTQDLPDTFIKKYGYDITDRLPEIFRNIAGQGFSPVRGDFRQHLGDRFAEAFCDNIGAWCEKNGIGFTAHMLNEPSLRVQTFSIGEAMRSYKSMHLPGIDMLCNSRELTTAKQTQSVAHQCGREGIMSELYGVTGWDFDFRGHKYQGDWQAALGVTQRVPHLSWYSMHGNAKRDYPASIFYQSPWYREYRMIEDHYARLNTVLTRGEPQIRIGMIHPIESYWLAHSSRAESEQICNEIEALFQNSCNWLVENHLDFNYISESLIPELLDADTLKIGKMAYDAIVVPGCITLRSSTLDYLSKFALRGGKVIFIGTCPEYIDYRPSDAASELYGASLTINASGAELAKALENMRDITIRYADGKTAKNFLYQLRRDGKYKWVFLAHLTQERRDSNNPQQIVISLNGEYKATLFDTLSGTTSLLPCRYESAKTHIPLTSYDTSSFLIRLEEGKENAASDSAEESHIVWEYNIKEKVAFSREEQNVLLLDMAEYSIDGGNFEPIEEILRIGIKAKKLAAKDLKLMNEREVDGAQPWVLRHIPEEHTISLRYTFESEIEYTGALLAAERADKIEITLNGEKVKNCINGYFVDEDILTVALPKIEKGKNILTVTYPFGLATEIEAMYLLGDFDVRCEGCSAVVCKRRDKVAFGSIVEQGMPFYGGNITYECEIELPDSGMLEIEAPLFRGSLIGVRLDGNDVGKIAFSPYRLTVDANAGKHKVELTLFGNRYNTFGALHNTEDDTPNYWQGPSAWYTSGTAWSYEYQFRRTGILKSPTFRLKK